MNDLPDTRVIDQVGCARCGATTHPQITFTKFKHPIKADPYLFTYWAPCPTTGEPILMQIDGDAPSARIVP